MKVTLDNLNLLHSALTHFVSEPVSDVSRFEDSIVFTTATGRFGYVERNFSGNFDIWVGDEVVYEIEERLLSLIEVEKSKPEGLIEFYELVKDEVPMSLEYQPRSKEFFDIVKNSVENIIINHNLPIVGDATIGIYQVHYTKDTRIKINLN